MQRLDSAKGLPKKQVAMCLLSGRDSERKKTKQNSGSVEHVSSRAGLRAPLKTHRKASPEGGCGGEVRRGLSGGVMSNGSARGSGKRRTTASGKARESNAPEADQRAQRALETPIS